MSVCICFTISFPFSFQKTVKRVTGIEVNDFTTVKAIVVCRPRCQSIIVDKPGISVNSSMDKNLKIFVPREAFQQKTELRLEVGFMICLKLFSNFLISISQFLLQEKTYIK